MKEKPILFSTPMVRAILDGRKTQTRRIVKKQPHGAGEWIMQGINWLFPNINPYINLKCPYGESGDVLWVRETWNTLTEYVEKPDHSVMSISDFVYKADDYRFDKWKPSIYMPKEACRIKLLIENIRVEMLKDISGEDAKAEGVYFYGWDDATQDDYKNYLYNDKYGDDWGVQSANESYITLWESINGKGSWDVNPWVWVIRFKRIN